MRKQIRDRKTCGCGKRARGDRAAYAAKNAREAAEERGKKEKGEKKPTR